MTLSYGPHCRFSIFAHRMWRTALVWSSDQCRLCWLCCHARCWMLQDMDNMEASCVFYVKVGTFNHLEHSKLCLLTVNKMWIVRLIIKHDMMFSVSFMQYTRDFLRQTSAELISLKEGPINIPQSWDFGCRKPQFIPVNTQTTWEWLIGNHGTVGNPCNLYPYPTGFILSIMYKLAAIHYILTCS